MRNLLPVMSALILLLLIGACKEEQAAAPETQPPAPAAEAPQAQSQARPAAKEIVTDYSDPLTIRSFGTGDEHEFRVEVADTMEKTIKGLMYRESMPEDAGMLFIFEEQRPRNFWMKNTVMPLDIIFIDADGVIATVHENAIPFDLTRIPSKAPVKYVLEVNAGTAARLGIKPGDTVVSERIQQ